MSFVITRPSHSIDFDTVRFSYKEDVPVLFIERKSPKMAARLAIKPLKRVFPN